MKLKEGDEVTLDGNYEKVISVLPQGYYFQHITNGSNTWSVFYMSFEDVESAINSGRMKFWGTSSGSSTASCIHNWKKYVGFREVYEYCTKCSVKQSRDWRLIKDEKEY